MRLTLRTLLAYLDDTLEPLEIKTIGQKVAESETAQELIARIKQATRRRRITTPPATGPNSFEPNMVADYLDNELSSEQVAELEKICLESDVHLAEVASCHQILTLVLGEPAAVPPTAKERMYALVRGREAIPFRKAAAAGGNDSSPTSADTDADEMFLLGLPFYRRGSWLRWALPLAAVLLFAVVGVALWQSIHGLQQPSTPTPQVAQGQNPKPEVLPSADKAAPKTTEKDGDKEKKPAVLEQPNTVTKPLEDKKTPEPKKEGSTAELKTPDKVSPPTKEPEKTAVEQPANAPTNRQAESSKERSEVGQYRTGTVGPPSLLVQRKDDKDNWVRVGPGGRVFTRDQLLSLPGYASEVWLDCGVHLLLRGHLREFTPSEARAMDALQESAIVLNKPKNTDVDVTLERGRLFVSNHKKDSSAAVVRLRFEGHVWDLTLQSGAEAVFDLFKFRVGGEPQSALKLFLLKGGAGLAMEQDHYPNLSVPGIGYFLWDSRRPSAYDRQPVSEEDLKYANRVLFAKEPAITGTEASDMQRALKTLKNLMTIDKSPIVALREVLDKPEPEKRYEHRLAIYCLSAMDEIKEVLNLLGQSDLINAQDRVTAILALRRWLDRGPNQSDKLFNSKTKKGILVSELSYTTEEAERIMELLRDPTDEQILSAETYDRMARDLTSEKVAIAELARWRLYLLGVVMFRLDLPNLKNFNAALPRDKRAAARKEVLEKVSEGVLPPPLQPGKAGPGGRTPPAPKGGIGTNPEPRPKK